MADLTPFSLEDRVAIVTGGSRGIGFGIAQGLAAAGAHVVIAGRSVGPAKEAATVMREMGRESLHVACDVRRSDHIERLVVQTMATFGRIDIVVSNAGSSFGDTFQRAPLLHLSERDFDGCFTQNVKSHFLLAKEVAPIMLNQRRGSIITIASTAGREGTPPTPAFGFYGPAKAALIRLTNLMAAEWGPEIRVNCVAPGIIDTPRTAGDRPPGVAEQMQARLGMERFGLPEDVAGACVFLASDAAAWITGATLDVHGGPRSAPVAR